jgi:DNA repair exonuclease SbcCD ATPase subunit
MLESWVRYLAVACGLLFVVPSFCHRDGTDGESAWRLKREVEECERQLTRAQRELAEARARLALTEGKRESAIAELRKAVACREGEVQWIRAHANWFCDPREPMDEARWDLANTRVWLAEIEGDAATLVTAWKEIVGFHERRLERARRLEQMRAMQPAEVTIVQQALAGARQRLEAAEKHLAAGRAPSPEQSK